MSLHDLSKCWLLSCVQLCNLWIVATRLLCPWNSPGMNTGVSFHSLLQGILQTQGWNPGLLHCKQIASILPSEPPGKTKFMSTTLLSWLINCQYSDAWSAPISRLISTCEPLDERLSAAWLAPVSSCTKRDLNKNWFPNINLDTQ